MWADPVKRTPIAAWPVARLLRRPKSGSAPIAPELVSLLATTHRAAGAIGAKLLDAKDEADLAERLEALVDEGIIVGHFDAILAELGKLKSGHAILDLTFEIEDEEKELADQFEADVAALVHEALRLHEYMCREGADVVSSESNAATPDGSGVYDDLLHILAVKPLPFARAVLDSLRGLGAMFALFGAGLNARPLPGWLARALARTWRDGEIAALKVIACGDADVPEQLLPTSERLDVASMTAESAATSRRLTDVFARARASGLPVFPVPSDDDE